MSRHTPPSASCALTDADFRKQRVPSADEAPAVSGLTLQLFQTGMIDRIPTHMSSLPVTPMRPRSGTSLGRKRALSEAERHQDLLTVLLSLTTLGAPVSVDTRDVQFRAQSTMSTAMSEADSMGTGGTDVFGPHDHLTPGFFQGDIQEEDEEDEDEDTDTVEDGVAKEAGTATQNKIDPRTFHQRLAWIEEQAKLAREEAAKARAERRRRQISRRYVRVSSTSLGRGSSRGTS